jgi:hypothetical protein
MIDTIHIPTVIDSLLNCIATFVIIALPFYVAISLINLIIKLNTRRKNEVLKNPKQRRA